MILGYSDHVALVTGGTRGIGQAIALALLGEGCRVAVAGQTQRTADELADLFPDAGERVVSIGGDLSRHDTAPRLLQEVVGAFGQLDILVNNAAGYTEGDVLAAADDEWEKLFQTKVLGYVRMTRAAEPHLARSESASVLNVAGILAISPRPSAGPASVVNAGVLTFTRIAARELGPRGIRVNSISPGAVRASRFASRVDHYLADHGGDREAAERALLRASPTGHPVDLAEIGMLAAFICSPRIHSLAGANVVIDGGLTT